MVKSQISIAETIEEIKSLFEDEIVSVRRLDCINSLNELIDLLYRRNLLTVNNIALILQVAARCKELHLNNFADYLSSKRLKYTIKSNRYKEQRLAEAKAKNTSQDARPEFIILTKEKDAAINKIIAQEIGSSWRRLGRELDIGEAAMDEIELQFPRDLSSRIYKLLRLFEEDGCHDPKQHILLLCSALERCKRKDLRRKVEKILNN